METETKGGIIIAHHSLETIELAPSSVNYDQTIEEMVVGEGFYNPNSNLTTANLGASKGGKTGVIELSLLLARPVPSGQAWSTEQVLACLKEAGLVPEELPALTVVRDHADEIYAESVPYVTALGEASRWQDPDGHVYVPYVDLPPEYRRFHLYSLEYDWHDYDWFVVRRK